MCDRSMWGPNSLWIVLTHILVLGIMGHPFLDPSFFGTFEIIFLVKLATAILFICIAEIVLIASLLYLDIVTFYLNLLSCVMRNGR